MSRFSFEGTINEILTTSSGKELHFVPDREYAITKKQGKNEILFVAFLPDDGNEGIVFKYRDNVHVVDKGKVKWVPTWKINGHYTLVLEGVTEKKVCDIEIKDAPTSKFFKLKSVTEKA